MPMMHGKNLAKIKLQNLESIKRILFRYAPLSRAEIAERLELTPPTITNIVAELIQHTLPDAKRKTGNFRGHIVVFRFIQNQFQCRAVAAATSGFNAERTFGTSS